jgi:hypothetical protein
MLNSKNLPILSFYYLIYFGIGTTAVSLVREYFLEHLSASLSVGIVLFLAPLLVFFIAKIKPSFAKWLRISFFTYFRVSTLTKISFVILILFCGIFVYNYISFGFSGEQIFLNVFFLNLIVLFFISLVLTKRFQIREPVALLIRKDGTPEVYLFRNSILRHIPDPPTLQLLGYSFLDVQVISDNEFQKYKRGGPLESVATANLIQANGKPEVYIIIGEEKHHVPDPNTLITIQMLNKQVGGNRLTQVVHESEVNRWPTGQPLLSVIPQ